MTVSKAKGRSESKAEQTWLMVRKQGKITQGKIDTLGNGETDVIPQGSGVTLTKIPTLKVVTLN